MPCSARNAAIAARSSVSVASSLGNSRRPPWCTSGIVGRITPVHRCIGIVNALPSDRLEQKLQNLDMALGLGQCIAPRVQPVAAQQERVRSGLLVERLADALRKPRHVLIVLDDRNPLAVLVRSDAAEPLEHLVAFDREAARARVPSDRTVRPHRVGVQRRHRPPARRAISTCNSVSAEGLPEELADARGRACGLSADGHAVLVALQDVAPREAGLCEPSWR